MEKGSLLATVFGNDAEKVKKAGEKAINAFTIEQRKPEKTRLIRADHKLKRTENEHEKMDCPASSRQAIKAMPEPEKIKADRLS